jgi:hypothetical protein
MWAKFTGAISRALGQSVGRGIAFAFLGVLLLGGAWAAYRAWVPGPDTSPGQVPEVAPGLPPLIEESTVVRPDSSGSWLIETVPGNYDATLTIDLPNGDSARTGPGEGGPGESVSIGLREGAAQFFPERPGARRLPVEASIIGDLSPQAVRIKAQPQPILSLTLQAEAGIGGALRGPGIGGLLGVTGARVFGARLGGFALAVPPDSRGPTRLQAGPYASVRVYGPFGVGIGKDITRSSLLSVKGITLSITANIPLP